MRGDSIRGWLDPAEGRILADLAGLVPAHQEIVEIGAFAGRSTAYLAEGAANGKGAHITSLDDWSPAAIPAGTDQDAANLVLTEYLGNADFARVTPLRARSTSISPTWLKPIGLVFLDATHLYEDTVRDIAEWSAHLALGGRMAFHDYHPDHPGVIRATDEAIASGRWIEESLTVSLRVLKRKPEST